MVILYVAPLELKKRFDVCYYKHGAPPELFSGELAIRVAPEERHVYSMRSPTRFSSSGAT